MDLEKRISRARRIRQLDILWESYNVRDYVVWYDEDKIFIFPALDSLFYIFESLGYNEISKVPLRKGFDLEEIIEVMDIDKSYTLLKNEQTSDYVILYFELYEIEFNDKEVNYIKIDDKEATPKNLGNVIHTYALTKVLTLTPEKMSEMPLEILKKVYKIPSFYDVRNKVEQVLSLAKAMREVAESKQNFYQ